MGAGRSWRIAPVPSSHREGGEIIGVAEGDALADAGGRRRPTFPRAPFQVPPRRPAGGPTTARMQEQGSPHVDHAFSPAWGPGGPSAGEVGDDRCLTLNPSQRSRSTCMEPGGFPLPHPSSSHRSSAIFRSTGKAPRLNSYTSATERAPSGRRPWRSDHWLRPGSRPRGR